MWDVDMVAVVGYYIPLKRRGGQHVGVCPFHNDTVPSLVVYDDHAYCFGCGRFFDAVQFISEKEGVTDGQAKQKLQDRSLITRQTVEIQQEKRSLPPINHEILDYWYDCGKAPNVRKYYYSRLLTDKYIDFYRLGWDGTHYVIPIWEGMPGVSKAYNVKFRNSTGDIKYSGLPGRSDPKLFNSWVLETNAQVKGPGDWKAIIMMGEFDAILATQDGLPVVSGTAGQGVWKREWTLAMAHIKRIWVVPDKGEERSAYNIASKFLNRATVHTYSGDYGMDYTEYRRDHTPQDFCTEILNIEPSLLL